MENFRLLNQRHAQILFLGEGLGIVSAPNFVYEFSRKMFFMLYYID